MNESKTLTLFDVIKWSLKLPHTYELISTKDNTRALLEAKRGDYLPGDLVELGGVLYRVIN